MLSESPLSMTNLKTGRVNPRHSGGAVHPDAGAARPAGRSDPRPAIPQAPGLKQPLTRPVAEASGGTALTFTGYRGYRGVPKVGAWTWVKDFDIGLVTDRGRGGSAGTCGFCGWGSAFISPAGGQRRRGVPADAAGAAPHRVRTQAALKAKRLGAICARWEIGSGGFGTVYRGHHALMRRPVAVKLLDPERGQ